MLFRHGDEHPPGERIQYLFKLEEFAGRASGRARAAHHRGNGKTLGEAKAELRRGIENVEVACGIPMMMQGYNLEDVTPGVDENPDSATAGSGCCHRAL